jgi:hypothetical protein
VLAGSGPVLGPEKAIDTMNFMNFAPAVSCSWRE